MLSLKSVTRTVCQFFSSAVRGMVGYIPNHLHGSRRVYRAQVSMAQEFKDLIREDQSILREINRILTSRNHVLLRCAVVNNEVRINAYGVVYGTETGNHYVGLDDPYQSGVSSFLVCRNDQRKLAIQDVLIPHREKLYNPYEVEFSWSMPLTDIVGGVLHTSPFVIQEC